MAQVAGLPRDRAGTCGVPAATAANHPEVMAAETAATCGRRCLPPDLHMAEAV